MQKRKVRQFVAIIAVLVLIFLNWSSAAIAEGSGETASAVSSGETPLIPIDQGSGGSADVMPLDIEYGDKAWHLLTTATTVYHAPYGTGCASTGYTLAAGKGVFIIGREYEYYYVYWTVDTSKEMYGYIPITSISGSYNSWIQYDVYRRATCTATTQVLSGPGTTNTYVSLDTITANQTPLMVLGKKVNQYNNVTYYFIQYEKSGLVRRGWVDSSLGTVTYHNSISTSAIENEGRYFTILSADETMALTWDATAQTVLPKAFVGNTNQMFKLEKAYTNNSYMGYYRLIPATDDTKAVAVSAYGYANNLPLILQDKGQIDKRQEFLVGLVNAVNASITENSLYFSFQTRSSGDNRAITLSGDKIIHSTFNSSNILDTQIWKILRIGDPWDGGYGLLYGSRKPYDFEVHVSPEVKDYFSLSEIQSCLDRWINPYHNFNLKAVDIGNQMAVNRLATIRIADNLEDTDVVARTKAQEIVNNLPSFIEPVDYDDYHDWNWHSTEIHIYINNMNLHDYTKENMLKTITHEIGHALKLTHTYQSYLKTSSGNTWIERSQSKTIMDQGESSPGTPTSLDIFRLKEKWDQTIN